MPIRVAFAGGGTGGHLTPALAVAEAVGELYPGSEIVFFGARGGIEERVMPKSGYRMELFDSPKPPSGLLRKGLQAPVILWRLLAARRQVRKLMRELGIEVIVGTGGYVSAAPLWAAAKAGLPAILLEQNAIPGRANRFIARWAREVHTQFAESVGFFGRSVRVEVTGNPVKRSVRELRGHARPAVGAEGPTLLVTGGSQGAQRLNELVAEALPEIAAGIPGLRLLHLSGKEGSRTIQEAFAKSRVPGEVHEYTHEMESFYSRADLVLARAGATTIAELTCVGLPSVLVPYPFAADDHQRANARVLEKAGAAVALDQSGLTAAGLAATLIKLMRDKGALASMAAASRALGRPSAAEDIAGRVHSLARTSERN
jgi:UDP-N-acetylglucosamine--N-acetylmuramyl-(pentapeptide) pyrophosphoryl-undecaprenol N-acetylglucosamine transferase